MVVRKVVSRNAKISQWYEYAAARFDLLSWFRRIGAMQDLFVHSTS